MSVTLVMCIRGLTMAFGNKGKWERGAKSKNCTEMARNTMVCGYRSQYITY